MAVIRKRKLKTGFVYDIDFHYRNKRYIISTRTDDSRTAKRILNDIEHKISLGTFNMEEYEKKEATLEKFFEEYFTYAATFKKSSTVKNERVIARDFMKHFGRSSNLRSVTLRGLDQWKAEVLQRLRPATFNIHRRFLHAAFNVAIKWGYLDNNPVGELSMMKVEEVRNFMKEEEVKKLFDLISRDITDRKKEHLRTFNILFRNYLEFLLNTGLRRTEAISLQINNVDFAQKLIYVEQTKAKKYRPIPLNVRAYQILQELGPDLFSKLNAETVTHKFNDIMVRLKMTQFKLHSLRHTFATRLVSAGVDILAVKELLGHHDIRTSMVYAKANTETLRTAVERLKN